MKRQSKFGTAQYEAHITLGKTNESQQNDLILSLNKLGFKVIDLAVINRPDLQNEAFDTITTSHSSNLQDLVDKTYDAVYNLKKDGFEVLRYKIESTIFDSKFEDTFKVL
jgi:aryl-alcohol dehydrogenase-like predicted oxidoreductase